MNLWNPEQWWLNTQDARDRAARNFDQTQGVHNPRNVIPFQDEHTRTNAPIIIEAAESADEFHYALGVPEETIRRIAEWVGTLDLGDAEEIIEPEEYHITIAYAPHGWNDIRAHHMVKNFNLSGTRFTAKGLSHFNQGAIVVELDSPTWKDSVQPILNRLKTLGLEVSEFEGGPKAHITVAYGPTLPEVKSPLALNFRAEHGYISTPRGLGKPVPFLASSELSALDSLDLGLEQQPSGWGSPEHFAQPWVGNREICKWCGGPTEDGDWITDANGNDVDIEEYCSDCGRNQSSLEHALAWTPGKWGKGYFNNKGQLHTWNTDQNWAPIHSMYQFYYGGHPSQEHAAFQINPAGEVRLWGNPELHQEQMERTRQMVTQIDPRLKSEEAVPYWSNDYDPDRWKFIGNVLPGVACQLHAWVDCPLCTQENEAEHNPEYEPTNDFDEAKNEWYNTRKEPGLVNPPDPFVDLKGPFQASYINAHSDYSGFDS
jgi:2'-5' RNA ligase